MCNTLMHILDITSIEMVDIGIGITVEIEDHSLSSGGKNFYLFPRLSRLHVYKIYGLIHTWERETRLLPIYTSLAEKPAFRTED